MDHNNSNIPVVKVGDTIYETYGSYGSLCKRKVERITTTQIILDKGTKLRNEPLRMYGNKEAYYLNAVSRNSMEWSNTNYYLETEEFINKYEHQQLFGKIEKIFESLNLKKLTNEQLNILLSAMTSVTVVKDKP